MNIEVKALIASLLVAGVVIGAILGTARTVRSGILMNSARPMAPSSAGKDPRVMAGAGLFALNCARCHGVDATGDVGPDLHQVTKTDARIQSIILNGIKGEMPAFGKRLSENDAATLLVFIRSLMGKQS